MELYQFTKDELAYIKETNEATEACLSPYATTNKQAVRKKGDAFDSFALRNNYAVDIDRIIHCPVFNRGADKTQVFSFYHNDDITRRSSHVHLVSRIARVIGKALRLNLDLIEAIAIGHDIGHTPFGHKGEEFLNKLYYANTKRYFNHNIHSARVLMYVAPVNLTLQTLDGIICHNGERAFTQYEPAKRSSFQELEEIIEACYVEKDTINSLRPSTLEGCVVRISDIIAYLGKDRQDASRVKLVASDEYEKNAIGTRNTEIITNIINNILKNSIGQNYIKMDESVLKAIEAMRKENYERICNCDEIREPYYTIVEPMIERLYDRFLEDVENRNFASPIFQHHLNHPIFGNCYRSEDRSIISDPNEIVVDFIASMTDDYFLDVFRLLFPDDALGKDIPWVGYFDSRP